MANFKCFGMFNSCDNNIDNSVTDISSQDNDVNITDSFNHVTVPGQICGNCVESTSINDTSTCTIGDTDISNGSPSTLGLS